MKLDGPKARDFVHVDHKVDGGYVAWTGQIPGIPTVLVATADADDGPHEALRRLASAVKEAFREAEGPVPNLAWRVAEKAEWMSNRPQSMWDD